MNKQTPTNAEISKILEDPFYGPLYTSYGYEYVVKAGFFYTPNVPPILSTPTFDFKRTKELYDPTKKQCIVLLAGCFAPFHKGHLQCLQKARKHLVSQGFQVLQGIIAPAHQEYIDSKKKDKALTLGQRLQSIHELIENKDWLAIDYYTAVYNQTDINFTLIIDNIQKQLKVFDIDIPVYFICGGDNSSFAYAFKQKGNACVINRPGYEQRFNDLKAEFFFNKRIVFVENNNSLSSTEVLNAYRPVKKDLVLRINSKKDNPEFINRLCKLLSPSFTSIRIVDAQSQMHSFNNWVQDKHCICLDSLIDHRFNLKISRLYNLYGGQKWGYINRPGSKPLNTQLLDLRTKVNKTSGVGWQTVFTLFDDDIASGKTIKHVKKLLKASQFRTEEKSVCFERGDNTEILDARDFVIGHDNGGLVINYNNQILRAPYIFPFVDPSIRASIINPVEFSQQVLELNKQMILSENWSGKKLQILSSLKPWSKNLYKPLGFNNNSTLLEVIIHLQSIVK